MTKQKRKPSPKPQKSFRPVYLLPVLIAFLIVAIPSMIGKWRIDYFLSEKFLYSPASLLVHDTLHFIVALILLLGWVAFILVRTKIIYGVIGFFPICFIWGFAIAFSWLFSNATFSHRDTYSTDDHIYYVDSIEFRMSLYEVREYYVTVTRCDSVGILCENVYIHYSKYPHYEYSDWGLLQLERKEQQLVLKYYGYDRTEEGEIVTVVEDDMEKSP